MNYKRLIPVFALAAIFATACEDTKMEWEERDPASEITEAEIPLQIDEKIARYDALNTYTDFKLGVGIGMDLYMEDEVFDSIVKENFDDVTVGYLMKHGPMVNSDGELEFDNVDAFVQKARNAGLTIFGHTLVWHQNQNASYLNGLIAPEIIPGPAGSNALDISGLQDGSFTEWERLNPGDGIEVVDGEGVSGDDRAVEMIAGSGSSNYWDLQLKTPDIAVDPSHTYEISFFIRSDQPGAGRISFEGLDNNYPWKDWNSNGDGTESFETTSTYQQVKFTVDDFTGASFNFFFDLGPVPGVTYYIDVENIMVVDLDAEPAEVNYVLNGGFESGDLTNWVAANAGAGIEVTGSEAFEGDFSAMMTAGEASSNAWDLQLQSDDITVPAGNDYVLTFYVKADQPGEGRISFPGLSNEWPYKDWTNSGGDWTESFDVTTSWQQITAAMDNLEFEAGSNSFQLSFDFGYIPDVTYYVDDIRFVEVTEEPAGAPSLKSVTTIEKSDEEKTQIIGEALENWISQMVGHYKNDIHAWDVVNEPMNENGTLRDGEVDDPANDEFYWQKYLGKDYAVTAFELAREYGNSDDILFINDYNLEHSIPKCEGIIEYVEYIESNGVTVDGIGTQMHVNINSNRDNIEQMFRLLAATGKLIKVSELDVQVQTDSPSDEDFEKQAEMYQFIAESYREIIPEGQQYGITVWGVSDAAQEHEHWLPDDAPCIWDANYQRKLSYKTFADGLAGYDVSEDFTGELQD